MTDCFDVLGIAIFKYWLYNSATRPASASLQKNKKNMPRIKKKTQKGFLSSIKFTESYTSLILGAIVVLIVGILFVLFAKGGKNSFTSSIKDIFTGGKQESQDSNTSSTYTVRSGDDLWTISENLYKNGFKWTEIAKVNKLENPRLIYSGDKLIIPTITQAVQEKVVAKNEILEKTPSEITKNKSITENVYTVVKGDNLWNIAVRAYGDGFKWTEIAKANNLVNPSLIHPGNIFKIPR